MMRAGVGAAVAAIFPDKSSAEACLHELKQQGFQAPWLAVTKPAPREEPDVHDIAETSDGVFGTIGRFFSGESSLRQALTVRGLSESDAKAIDDSIPDDGAVVVVGADERSGVAASILGRQGTSLCGPTLGHNPPRFADPRPSSTETVAGQADDLDRGTGVGASGGGLGASTGFWSDDGSRRDLGGDVVAGIRAGDLPESPVYYERSSRIPRER